MPHVPLPLVAVRRERLTLDTSLRDNNFPHTSHRGSRVRDLAYLNLLPIILEIAATLEYGDMRD
jgi:hypothetical protein